ncbi:MAG: hypothetical protein Q8881_02695 [Sweet potato little leaf phytoplasma]|nr:hypothetical protein [Sweet potato little leaf phytoplasma]
MSAEFRTSGTFPMKRPNFRRISHSGTFSPKRPNQSHRISANFALGTFPPKRPNQSCRISAEFRTRGRFR